MTKADSFVHAEIGGKEARTNYVKDQSDPVFNQKLLIPVTLPAVDQTLKIKIYENEFAGRNFLGCEIFSLYQIKQGKFVNACWVHFYGPNDHTINQAVIHETEELSKTGSTYKGSILLALTLEESTAPEAGLKSMLSLDFERVRLRPVPVYLFFEVLYV